MNWYVTVIIAIDIITNSIVWVKQRKVDRNLAKIEKICKDFMSPGDSSAKEGA